MPRSVSQRAQGSVVGASLHPVALVNVEVLGTNGCLVATDHRGPRPLPTLSYPPRVPLPTGSPKSRIGSAYRGAGGPSRGRDSSGGGRWGVFPGVDLLDLTGPWVGPGLEALR